MLIFYITRLYVFNIILHKLKLNFHNVRDGHVDTKSQDYFKLSFIMTKLDNLDATFGGYFKLCFIMAKVSNLEVNFRELF